MQPQTPPLSWHRQLARLVARKWGVQMVAKGNLSEGTLANRHVALRCAKSKRAPIAVSQTSLERASEIWGIFLTQTDAAEIWTISTRDFKRVASFYSPPKGSPIYVVRYKKFSHAAQLLGVVPEDEVGAVEIP